MNASPPEILGFGLPLSIYTGVNFRGLGFRPTSASTQKRKLRTGVYFAGTRILLKIIMVVGFRGSHRHAKGRA